jgi:hypothetical protein
VLVVVVIRLVDSEFDFLAVLVLSVKRIMPYLDFSEVMNFEFATFETRRHMLGTR